MTLKDGENMSDWVDEVVVFAHTVLQKSVAQIMDSIDEADPVTITKIFTSVSAQYTEKLIAEIERLKTEEASLKEINETSEKDLEE